MACGRIAILAGARAWGYGISAAADAFPGGNVGALVYHGLFTICTRGYALFTGKACYPFEKQGTSDLLIIWVGNLLGTMLAGIETHRHRGAGIRDQPPPPWWTERWGTVT